MNRDEILGMDDVELYISVSFWLFPDKPAPIEWSRQVALDLCYQAEEKIKEMNKPFTHIRHLAEVIEGASEFDLIRAHPRDRARAILLTLNERGGM